MDSKGFITVNKVCLKPCGLCAPAASPHSFHLLDSQMMQTNADGVFAGGDAVTFPFPPRNNKKVNIPHWQMAHVHGGCVAAGPSRQAQDFCPSSALLFILRTDGSSQHDGQSC